MDASSPRAMQAPIKERYRSAPEAAIVTLRAEAAARPQGARRLDEAARPRGSPLVQARDEGRSRDRQRHDRRLGVRYQY